LSNNTFKKNRYKTLIFNKMNTIIKLSLFICFIISQLAPLSCEAQNNKKKKDNPYIRSRTILERIPIHGSALTSLKFIGFRFGIDYPIRIYETRSFFEFRAGRTIKERYLTADIGAWHYDGIHENTFFNLEFTMRRVSDIGFFLQITPLGVGVNYTIPPVFKVFDTKKYSVDSIPLNRFFATPSISVGIGKDFGVKSRGWGFPLTALVKVGVSTMYPYKTYGYIIPSAEFSLAYRLKRFTTMVKKTAKS
jgi:hypothetical protein